ncbi:EAL domain-containing protein [Salidesulfovibrio onnuriiensis]|uniref:EAL domain-containing protein n=1 Tax=Salidesulfovibrio onnuriiensis TaxID=2583823 RepID=UPI0011C9013B|nr:EAL domain-containing protein [Salidesulfovibrio onnuriiensis]
MLSLRKTTFLILLFAFGILVSVIYCTSTLTLLPRFRDIEERHLQGDMERARSIPVQQSRVLNTLVRDWAWWDDTYQFITDKNEEFIESNLPPSTFHSSGLNLIGFYDTMGQVVWGAYLETGADSFSPIPWDFEDFVFSRVAPWGKRFTGKGFNGIAKMGDVVWILACEQILTSNEQGPHRGWLLMGRILETAALEGAAKNAHINLHVDIAKKRDDAQDQQSRIWRENGYINVRSVLHDINGVPALTLTLREPTDISRAGQGLVRLNFALISLASLVLGSLAMLLLQRRILGRISLLARQATKVASNPEEAYDIAIPGNDEITSLARDVNRMLQQTKEEERFLENMMQSLQVGVLLVSVENREIVEANPYACDMIGLPCGEIIGKMCHGFVCPNEQGACPVLDLNQPYDQRKRLLRTADGSEIPILKSVIPITRKGVPLLLETFVSIAEQEKTRQALEESENRYRTIFMNTGTASVIVNEDTTIALGNSEFYNMSGYSSEQIESGLSWTKCFHPDDVRWMMEYHAMRREDEHSVPKRYETRFINGKGETRNVELTVALFPGTKMSIASLLDITDRKQTEQELTHKAFYDENTGLPNQQLFRERLLHAMHSARRRKSLAGVLFLDIDDFHAVNEQHGFEAGNRVLKMVGERLQDSLRSNDTVGSLTKDEFAILTEVSSNTANITGLAHKVLELFDEAFDLDESPLYLTVCIGIAIYPLDGDTPESIMRNANLALFKAKTAGKGMVSLYTQDLNGQAMGQMQLKSDLHQALENDRLEVWYQPQVDLDSGEITGVEALVRWRKPDGTLAQPAEFLPFAEGTSLIRAIDLYVLEESCSQCAAWREAGHENIRLSVNLSAQPLTRGTLVGQVNEILDRTGLVPELLEIEITEQTLLEYTEAAVPIIRELSALGVGFTLDDFGTGPSSLFQLRELPLKKLKIDKAFTELLESDRAEGESLLSAIFSLAETLDVETVAKGVETARQLQSLRKLGCGHAQGFLFSPPIKAADLEKLLKSQPFAAS